MDWCVCAGLACRTLDPTKILVMGMSRLLINCSGNMFGCLMDWCVCAGLACRTLDPTKIMVVGKSRLLITCSCILFGCLMDSCVQGWRVEPWTPPRSWL